MSPALPRYGAAGRVFTAGLTVLAPLSLAAQTTRPAGPPRQAGAAPAKAAAPRWRFQVSANGSWYENAYFTGTDQSTTWSTGGRASLAYATPFRRGSFDVSGFGGMLYYPEIDNFTQPTYGGSLGLSWAPGRRTQIQIGQTYQRSNTREFTPVPAQDVPLPTSGLNSLNTTFSLSQGLSERWQLGLGSGFSMRRYDDPLLVDGKQLNASVQLSRTTGRHSSVYLSYAFGESWFESQTQRFHQALLGAQRGLGKGLDFDVGAGVAYVESVESFYPAGHAGLRMTSRRTTLALRYSRDFGQTFGYGRQTIADVISAVLTWTPDRRLHFDTGYNVGYRRDPAESGYEIRTLVASAGFGWTIAKDLGFSTHYYWERNETKGFDVVDGSRVTASLSYGVSWR
jgi:hypothetical protein